jgi:hypothetical protein
VPGRCGGEEDQFGQPSRLARLCEDAQPLGKKQPLLAPVPLLPEKADALDQGIGKSGYLAGQGSGPLFGRGRSISGRA